MVARLVIAGTSSGVGKTTVTVALTRALLHRGLKVALFKCGPDYLDVSYHTRAARAPCHTLDGWMMGHQAVLDTFRRATQGVDIALIEGVMGLYDSVTPDSEAGSTAEIAKLLRAPVMLVCAAKGMARSIAALTLGYETYDRDLRLASIFCNYAGSLSHVALLRRALPWVPLIGGFLEEKPLSFPYRHLGLTTALPEAVPEECFVRWGHRALESFDMKTLLEIAYSAPALEEAPLQLQPTPPPPPRRCRIGMALDEAFHFYYEDNLHRLEALGAQLVRFSPIHDKRLPRVDGLYIGGGYPEAHAQALAANAPMRKAVAAFAASGKPVYAECGGFIYLSQSVRTLSEAVYPMAGVFPAHTRMGESVQALGYFDVETTLDTLFGPRGLRFRGHQFRYSSIQFETEVPCAYGMTRYRFRLVVPEGYCIHNTLATYVHTHWASNPQLAEGFVESCVRCKRGQGRPRTRTRARKQGP